MIYNGQLFLSHITTFVYTSSHSATEAIFHDNCCVFSIDGGTVNCSPVLNNSINILPELTIAQFSCQALLSASDSVGACQKL